MKISNLEIMIGTNELGEVDNHIYINGKRVNTIEYLYISVDTEKKEVKNNSRFKRLIKWARNGGEC